jgi:hypothetical protein
LTKNTDPENIAMLTFADIDDTLFDEVVYSVNHNLCCAGR